MKTKKDPGWALQNKDGGAGSWPAGKKNESIGKGRIQYFSPAFKKMYIDLPYRQRNFSHGDRQWAGMMTGDEAYAGRVLITLEAAIRNIGYRYVVPTHQDGGAENIVSKNHDRTGGYHSRQYVFYHNTTASELAGGTLQR